MIDHFLFYFILLNTDNDECSLLATGCQSGLIAIHKIEKEELNKPYSNNKT